MGFVTFASFDDTLSISHKRNIDKSFFSPEISLRTAVTFFMVRSVRSFATIPFLAKTDKMRKVIGNAQVESV